MKINAKQHHPKASSKSIPQVTFLTLLLIKMSQSEKMGWKKQNGTHHVVQVTKIKKILDFFFF